MSIHSILTASPYSAARVVIVSMVVLVLPVSVLQMMVLLIPVRLSTSRTESPASCLALRNCIPMALREDSLASARSWSIWVFF